MTFRELVSSPAFWLRAGIYCLVPFFISLVLYQGFSVIDHPMVCDARFRPSCHGGPQYTAYTWFAVPVAIIGCFALACFLAALALCAYKNAGYATKQKERAAMLAAGLGVASCASILLYWLPAALNPMLHPVGASMGRPLRRKGRVHFSPVKESGDWLLDRRFSKPRHEWLLSAQGEHSSVAAFAKLSLELGALGCPPDLLAGAHQAALDEINHAQVAFTLDATKGASKGPARETGLLGAAGHLLRLQKMALSTFADGCLHEARSALELKKRAAEETDDAIRHEIGLITAEEETHVALAWKILAWCLREMPDDLHRARLFRHLTALLDAAARDNTDAETRGIFDEARISLQQIYTPPITAVSA